MNSRETIAIAGLVVAFAAVVVAVLTFLFGDDVWRQITGRSFFGGLHAIPTAITTVPQPTIEVVSPTSPPIATATRVPPTPSPSVLQYTPQPTPQVMGCAAMPINPDDGVEVSLKKDVWYVIEDFDNSLNPPVHKILVRQGPGTVIVVLPRGQRAWECPNEPSAWASAIRMANGVKANNPNYKVFGPDGKEVS